jgi:hypothetical protein
MRASLSAYTIRNLNAENFLFVSRCDDLANDLATQTSNEDFRVTPEQHESLRDILNTYVVAGSPSQVNTTSKARTQLLSAWAEVDGQPPSARNYTSFFPKLEQAVVEIVKVLRTDTFPRFVRDPESKLTGLDVADVAEQQGALGGALRAGRWPTSFLSAQSKASSSSSSSSSSVSSGTGITVQYLTKAEFAAQCQAFLLEPSLNHLAEIVRHIDAPHREVGATNGDTVNTIRSRLASWQADLAPSREQMDELETLITQLQELAV